jgi:hypothetical protein
MMVGDVLVSDGSASGLEVSVVSTEWGLGECCTHSASGDHRNTCRVKVDVELGVVGGVLKVWIASGMCQVELGEPGDELQAFENEETSEVM